MRLDKYTISQEVVSPISQKRIAVVFDAGKEVNDALVQWETVQQSLLAAEPIDAQDHFDEIQRVINLYHALGGGI